MLSKILPPLSTEYRNISLFTRNAEDIIDTLILYTRQRIDENTTLFFCTQEQTCSKDKVGYESIISPFLSTLLLSSTVNRLIGPGLADSHIRCVRWGGAHITNQCLCPHPSSRTRLSHTLPHSVDVVREKTKQSQRPRKCVPKSSTQSQPRHDEHQQSLTH